MFIATIVFCFLLKKAQTQLNGEFWWLNEKVAKYNRAIITPPMVEELSEFDTDSNTNIVFRDDDSTSSDEVKVSKHLFTTTEKVKRSSGSVEKDNSFNNDYNLIWSTNVKNGNNNFKFSEHLSATTSNSTSSDMKNNFESSNKENELLFVFPDNIEAKPNYGDISANEKIKVNSLAVKKELSDFNLNWPAQHKQPNGNNNNVVREFNSKENTLNKDVEDIFIFPDNNRFNSGNNFRLTKGTSTVTPTTSQDDKLYIDSNLNTVKDINKPSREITEPIFTSFSPYKNDDKILFTFPKKKETADYSQMTTKSIEKPLNPIVTLNHTYGLVDRPKFHNIIVAPQNYFDAKLEQQKKSQADSNVTTKRPSVIQELNTNPSSITFTFPQEDILKPLHTPNEMITNNITNISNTKSFTFGNDQLTNQITEQKKEKESENICSYMKKHECELRKGFVYTVELQFMLTKKTYNHNLICCILPPSDNKSEEDDSKIYFANKPAYNKRQKRYATEENTEQKQRSILLKKISAELQESRTPAPKTKIVNHDPDDEYVDPYWNIKNTKFQETEGNTRTKYDYSSTDYTEDYTDELPRPGLVGIYSYTDQTRRTPSWAFTTKKPANTYGFEVVYDSVESDETFGYSIGDPRKALNSKRKHRKPQKVTVSSEESPILSEPESHIVTFQSNPDFQVFQGFKLFNFKRNKNIETKLASTEVKNESDGKYSEEKDIENISESNEHESEEDYIYNDCGKSVNTIREDQEDKVSGVANRGFHPWLALVVETKKKLNILCYATIVHPRVAVTATKCVFGSSPGEITILAGLWNLNDKTRIKSRVVSIHIHPKYKTEDLNNGLAILYWQQPLRPSINIQPACLGKYNVHEKCMFYGWGGFDEGIRPRSRWQKATIRECRNRRIKNKQSEDRNVFCASVQSRNSIVGLGSPLMCNSDGRQSVTGFVVSRQNNMTLLSPGEWVVKTVKNLLQTR